MKRFLFTPYQIQYSTDDLWYEYRLSLFQTFCLPSIEANASDDLYWAIFLTRGVPDKHIRQLNKTISKSSIRGNIYIRFLEYTTDLKLGSERFMSEFCEDGEIRITGRMDQDDMLCKGLFDSVEQMYQEQTTNAQDTLYSFSNGIQHFLHDNLAVPVRLESHSMANYFVTRNSESYTFATAHTKAVEYANSKGFKVFQIESEKPYWGYSMFPASDQGTIYGQTNEQMMKASASQSKMETSRVFEELGVPLPYKCLSNFYMNFTPAPVLEAYLVGRHPLETVAKKLSYRAEMARNKWLEAFDYCNLGKPLIAGALAETAKRHDDFFPVINEVYGLSLRYDEALKNIKDGAAYLKFLCDCKDKVILMASKYRQKKLGLTSFCAIVKPANAIGMGRHLIECASSAEGFINLNRKLRADSKQLLCKIKTSSGVESISVISLDYVDYSINGDGLNIVVLDLRTLEVVDSVSINVYDDKLPLTRSVNV